MVRCSIAGGLRVPVNGVAMTMMAKLVGILFYRRDDGWHGRMDTLVR